MTRVKGMPWSRTLETHPTRTRTRPSLLLKPLNQVEPQNFTILGVPIIFPPTEASSKTSNKHLLDLSRLQINKHSVPSAKEI